MSNVVGASLSALLFPFMAQRGRRTHTYARCFARLLFRFMVQVTSIYMCGVLVSQLVVSFHGLKNKAYNSVLSVSLFRV